MIPALAHQRITQLEEHLAERDRQIVALANQADKYDMLHRKAIAKTEEVRLELAAANQRIAELGSIRTPYGIELDEAKAHIAELEAHIRELDAENMRLQCLLERNHY